jgi:hydroxymethylbilane synthase
MRIGTRGSALALVQAESVAERLRAAGHEVELVTITTSGDRGERVLDKSRWVQELEHALLEQRVDIAVHSAKDVPTDLPEEFGLIAVPAREDARDALCGAASLAELAPGSQVGTSSLRRAAQLRALRQDLEVVEVRGNVDTRLRKLADGEVDALVLAVAGLRRLGRESAIDSVLSELIPAPGQGALAVEALRNAGLQSALSDALDDPEASVCLRAERDLMFRLGASCQTPVGAYARVVDGDVEMEVWVGLPDGSEWISDRVTGAPESVSATLFERIRAAGAEELLGRAEAV